MAEEPRGWGDAGRTQVAVEYSGLVVGTPGEKQIQDFCCCPFVIVTVCPPNPQMTWGLPNLGMSLDICSEPLKKDSKVEILF